MTLAGTVAAVAIWLVVGLVAYGVVAGVVLFYLPPADRLESGAAVDAAFAFTVPLVLAATWLAAVRNRR